MTSPVYAFLFIITLSPFQPEFTTAYFTQFSYAYLHISHTSPFGKAILSLKYHTLIFKRFFGGGSLLGWNSRKSILADPFS